MFSSTRTLAPSVRAIPNLANIAESNIPAPIVSAFEERDRVRDLLAATRQDREEVAGLHRQALIADKNAAADYRLRQAGDVPEPAAPALAERLVELDEEVEVVALALTKAEDALAEALTGNVAALSKNAEKVLRANLAKCAKKIADAVRSYDEMQAAMNVVAFAAEIERGVVPRGQGRRLVTPIAKRNGDPVTVADALEAAGNSVSDFLGMTEWAE